MSRSIALLWGGVVLVLLLASPWASLAGESLWGCAFRGLTGIPCPTCGTTRAAVALARFDVLGALGRYPLPTLAWIAFLLGGLVASGMALFGRTPPAIPDRLPVPVRLFVVLAVTANWMYSIATGV